MALAGAQLSMGNDNQPQRLTPRHCTTEADDQPQRLMPRYRCHKEVWALKIAAIEFLADGSGKIAPADEGYAPFETEEGYRPRFHGAEDDLGYYVLYQDGYESWSPTKAFEEGYTRI